MCAQLLPMLGYLRIVCQIGGAVERFLSFGQIAELEITIALAGPCEPVVGKIVDHLSEHRQRFGAVALVTEFERGSDVGVG